MHEWDGTEHRRNLGDATHRHQSWCWQNWPDRSRSATDRHDCDRTADSDPCPSMCPRGSSDRSPGPPTTPRVHQDRGELKIKTPSDYQRSWTELVYSERVIYASSGLLYAAVTTRKDCNRLDIFGFARQTIRFWCIKNLFLGCEDWPPPRLISNMTDTFKRRMEFACHRSNTKALAEPIDLRIARTGLRSSKCGKFLVARTGTKETFPTTGPLPL